MATRLGSTTFRPLSSDLAQALETYQQKNFLPSKNAAINQILSRALLGNDAQPAPAPVSAPAPVAAQPAPVSAPPTVPPMPSLGGWQ